MKKEKTIFIEYSTSEIGQHFMTIIQFVNGQRKIIGRVYRQYDKENNKTKYLATDHTGSPIFLDTAGLTDLKREFVEKGKDMAYAIPDNPNYQHLKDMDQPDSDYAEREKELKEIREKKSEKDKEQGIER